MRIYQCDVRLSGNFISVSIMLKFVLISVDILILILRKRMGIFLEIYLGVGHKLNTVIGGDL